MVSNDPTLTSRQVSGRKLTLSEGRSYMQISPTLLPTNCMVALYWCSMSVMPVRIGKKCCNVSRKVSSSNAGREADE
jgi:hypothetical protein